MTATDIQYNRAMSYTGKSKLYAKLEREKHAHEITRLNSERRLKQIEHLLVENAVLKHEADDARERLVEYLRGIR